MTSGVPQETIEGLNVHQASILWQGWIAGLYGDLGTITSNYVLYQKLHNIQEILIQVNSKKKYKPKKPESLKKLFPDLWGFITGEVVDKDQLDKAGHDLTPNEIFGRLGLEERLK